MIRAIKIVMHSLLVMCALIACGGPHMPFGDKAKSTAGIAAGGSAGSTVNFIENIKPLFQAKCTACHGPGKMHPKDWTDYATALADKDLVNLRVVVAKTMPMGVALPEAERDLVAAWVNAGAPLNPPAGQRQPELAPPAEQPTIPPSEQPVPPPIVNPTPQPGVVLSFEKDIRPLIVKQCGMCHFSGGPFPNFQDYSVAFSLKDKIMKRAVEEKSMPPAGVGDISDAERAIIGEWIASGAQE